MEIYWRDQIDVPIIQWLHRIAYNQTYWTNWPTEANLACGTNGAFWAHTGLLVVSRPEEGRTGLIADGVRAAARTHLRDGTPVAGDPRRKS